MFHIGVADFRLQSDHRADFVVPGGNTVTSGANSAESFSCIIPGTVAVCDRRNVLIMHHSAAWETQVLLTDRHTTFKWFLSVSSPLSCNRLAGDTESLRATGCLWAQLICQLPSYATSSLGPNGNIHSPGSTLTSDALLLYCTFMSNRCALLFDVSKPLPPSDNCRVRWMCVSEVGCLKDRVRQKKRMIMVVKLHVQHMYFFQLNDLFKVHPRRHLLNCQSVLC